MRRKTTPEETILRGFAPALLFSIILFFSPECFSRDIEKPDTLSLFDKEPDTTFVKNYKNLVTTRLFFLFQDASITFYNPANQEKEFKPYVPMRFGIAAFYKWFGLGLSAGFPFTRNNYDKYVKSDVLDFRILAYSKIGTFELFYQNYKGFYLQGEEESPGDFLDFPEMRSWSAGFYATYAYNFARFSLRAAYIQNERQLKSAGSLMIRPAIHYYQLETDTPLFVPDPDENVLTETAKQFQRNNTLTLSLAPGYAYTFVFFKHFYINASVFMGVNYQSGKYEYFDHSETLTSDIIFNLLGRFAAGYNSDKWYFGASYVFNYDEYPLPSQNYKSFYNLNQLRIWLGTRFDLFGRKKAKK